MHDRLSKPLARGAPLLLIALLVPGCGQESPGGDEPRDGPGVVESGDGVPIAYEVHGQGEPALVLVHGWSCDRTYWEHQIGPLSERFRVITVDLAGHGESGTGREGWTMESFGGDVAAVVEELDLERVVLVGHSMGGDVITEAARRMQDRVGGLVWVDTYRELGSAMTDEQARQMLAPFRDDFAGTTRGFVRGMFPAGADSSLVERVVADMAAAPPEVAVEALGAAMAYGGEVTRTLRELDLPVVAINPAEPATDLESMEAFGVNVVTVPDVGHFVMMEDPEGFNRRLTEVVEGWGG